MKEENYLSHVKFLKSINYPKQDHWDIFDFAYYKKISSFSEMRNFRKNGISNMLETGLPSQDRVKLIASNDCYEEEYSDHEKSEIIKRFNQLRTMIGDDTINNYFCNTSVGNPRHLRHNQMDKNLF